MKHLNVFTQSDEVTNEYVYSGYLFMYRVSYESICFNKLNQKKQAKNAKHSEIVPV